MFSYTKIFILRTIFLLLRIKLKTLKLGIFANLQIRISNDSYICLFIIKKNLPLKLLNTMNKNINII